MRGSRMGRARRMNPEVRALFPGARARPYLDVAAKGLVPVSVRDHVASYLEEQVAGTMDKERVRARVEETRRLLAGLIGADADEVAITKNVSEGLNLFAASLPWAPGDNVVVCPDLEHPNNVYLWYNLVRRHGIEVRAVPSPDGVLPVEAMASAMDHRTRVVTFSTVSSVPGLRADASRLVEAARAVGALTLADGAQSVGAMHTDVHDLGVDAMAMTAQKCLLSFFGCGFLYVRRAVAETLTPVHLARFGVALDAPESEHSAGPLEYRPAALRFDLGNFNYLGVTATAVSLELLHRLGPEAVETHVRALARRLAEGMLTEGVAVVGGEDAARRAHIVAAGTFSPGPSDDATPGPSQDDASPGGIQALHQVLTARNVAHSMRRGLLRLSLAAYNDDTDVDAVLEGVRAWRRAG